MAYEDVEIYEKINNKRKRYLDYYKRYMIKT